MRTRQSRPSSFVFATGASTKRAVLVALFLLWVAPPALAEIKVTDDTGAIVRLSAPARRIVTLAPHAAELLFAIGAGGRIVATVEFSDHPEAARDIPRIGGSSGIDLERLVALKPDVIIAWSSGNPRSTIDRLKALGFPVYLTEPRRLADIARSLEQLGRLTGEDVSARQAAEQFRARYAEIARRYEKRRPLRVFYQVVDPLLVTVNGAHLISEVLRLCGGENIFAALPVLAPVVSEEAVLRENPDVILAGGTEKNWPAWQTRWAKRSELRAVKLGTVYFVSADTMHRHSPRVLDGASRACESLDDARRKLSVVK